MPEELCPECGEPLDYDEVDIGVGVQRGNYRCESCGWEPGPLEERLEDEENE